MSYKQLKALKQLCEYLDIKTYGDLQIVKTYSGCKNNKEFLNFLYKESLIKV